MTSSASRREAKQQARSRKLIETETPVLEFDFHPNALLAQGPVITTSLCVSDVHEAELTRLGQPLPPPVACRFLIDTGADGCLVKHQIAERAGLKLINENVPVRGVGVDTTGRVYLGRIMFKTASRRVPGVSHVIGINTRIMSGTLHDSDVIDGLIGRSVLAAFELRYNGKTGNVTMRFFRDAAT